MSYISWLGFIIIIIICIVYNDVSYYMIEKKNLFDPNQIKFRTGDLLFFRWNDDSLISYNEITKETTFNFKHLSDSICKTMYCMAAGIYTHVGMIVVIDNVPYIYEITNADTYSMPKYCHYIGKNVLNTPSLQKLKCIQHYIGHVYHYSYLGKPFNKKKLFKYIKNQKNQTIHQSASKFVKSCIYNKPYMVTCSSLIAGCLNDQNIFNYSNLYCATPGDLYKDCKKSKMYSDTHSLIKNLFSILHQ